MSVKNVVTIDGTEYDVVHENGDGDPCVGCHFYDDDMSCQVPAIDYEKYKCFDNHLIFIKSEPKLHPVQVTTDVPKYTMDQILSVVSTLSPTYFIKEEVDIAITYIKNQLTKLDKINTPEYKEYLRLKELFKDIE